jgi:hypothetical protein
VVAVGRHAAEACSSGGSTFEHQRSARRHNKRIPAGRPSCFFDRPGVKEPRQGGRQQRTRLGRSWCPRPRRNRRGNGRSGREGHGSDGSSREDAIQPKGQRIEPKRSQQRGSGREGRVSDGSNEGDEGVGGGACPAGQGPASDLAKGVDGTGDGRSSKLH